MNRLVICIVLLGFLCGVEAQSVKTLKERREKNRKELEYTNKILGKVRSKQSNTLTRLNVLQEDIKNREQSLQLFREEISGYDKQLDNAGQKIQHLTTKQQQLKKIYATLLSNAYFQSGTLDKWLYIFSAKDFTQAYNRYKYYEQFTDYTKKQLSELNNLQDSVTVAATKVEKLKQQKEQLAVGEQKEQQKLTAQKKQQQKEINRLKSKEKDLLARLKVQQQREKNLANKIRQVIRKSAKKTATKKPTKADVKLGNSFAANKGKLPWPTNGFVSSRFGEHTHPVLKTVKVRNDGIDITTKSGSVCKAIFGGEVSQVLSIAGLNNTVIVKHGSYLSVYANLVGLRVKKGEKITTGKVLGKIATASDGATVLKLQIWKGTARQNPAYWLRKR